ncbi:hypothetical protein [Staphylococcus saprophyticus]|uniref:hypothetical protein n=2 Tax=Staphylococcus TaxID=1279 RepID=UPI0028A0E478|nr:hypothetical protein [Staphylococcus saprophyticus]
MNRMQSILQKQEVMLDRKQRSFANDFDRWTRTNSEEQQQDDSNTGKSAKNERQATDREERDHDRSKERDEGLSR